MMYDTITDFSKSRPGELFNPEFFDKSELCIAQVVNEEVMECVERYKNLWLREIKNQLNQNQIDMTSKLYISLRVQNLIKKVDFQFFEKVKKEVKVVLFHKGCYFDLQSGKPIGERHLVISPEPLTKYCELGDYATWYERDKKTIILNNDNPIERYKKDHS